MKLGSAQQGRGGTEGQQQLDQRRVGWTDGMDGGDREGRRFTNDAGVFFEFVDDAKRE